MGKANLYIYRNLHGDNFSVKLRGRVIAHLTNPVVTIGSFKVNENGRQKVLREKQKNVHAFVVVKEPQVIMDYAAPSWQSYNRREVTYNPYKFDGFVYADNLETVEGEHVILMEYPKLYVLTY